MDASTGLVVVLVIAAGLALAAWRLPLPISPSKGHDRPATGKPDDHEQRLVKLEYQFKALELEWEDTRAKFLGMTRSFIRQAKAAGLDGPNGGGVNPDSQSGATLDAPSGSPSSRAAVLSAYRRAHARQ